jgi:hypothetical protein
MHEKISDLNEGSNKKKIFHLDKKDLKMKQT